VPPRLIARRWAQWLTNISMRIVINILLILLLTNCQDKKSNKKIIDKISEKSEKLKIYDLDFSWSEISRCNCIFAKSDDMYWRKEIFFAIDSVGNYGLIQFGNDSNRITLPVLTLSDQKLKGTEWTELYGNDTLRVLLNAKPTISQILRTHSYNVDFEMIHSNDTIRESIVGYCSSDKK
jgi:hypothetical protein